MSTSRINERRRTCNLAVSSQIKSFVLGAFLTALLDEFEIANPCFCLDNLAVEKYEVTFEAIEVAKPDVEDFPTYSLHEKDGSDKDR